MGRRKAFTLDTGTEGMPRGNTGSRRRRRCSPAYRTRCGRLAASVPFSPHPMHRLSQPDVRLAGEGPARPRAEKGGRARKHHGGWAGEGGERPWRMGWTKAAGRHGASRGHRALTSRTMKDGIMAPRGAHAGPLPAPQKLDPPLQPHPPPQTPRLVLLHPPPGLLDRALPEYIAT